MFETHIDMFDFVVGLVNFFLSSLINNYFETEFGITKPAVRLNKEIISSLIKVKSSVNYQISVNGRKKKCLINSVKNEQQL